MLLVQLSIQNERRNVGILPAQVNISMFLVRLSISVQGDVTMIPV